MNEAGMLPNLFFQSRLLPFDLRQTLDERFPLLALHLKAFDLKSELLQLTLADPESLWRAET